MAGLRVMISALHSSVLFGMPDTFMARSTYSSSCCLSTGFVRKPNAPLCVASTASGIVPCAVSSSTQRPGRWRWISFSSWMPSMLSMRRSVTTRSGRNRDKRGERFGRALDGLDVVVLGAQANAQQAQQARVVVDQQDATAQRRSRSVAYCGSGPFSRSRIDRSMLVMASSLARASSSASLSWRFSSSAAWSCCALRSLRCAVAAAAARCRRLGLGVEDQPLLDFFQMNQREDALLGQQRIARREQLAQQLLRLRGVARRMRRRGERERQHEPVRRRRRRVGRGRDVAEHVGLHDGVALDEVAQRLQIDGERFRAAVGR